MLHLPKLQLNIFLLIGWNDAEVYVRPLAVVTLKVVITCLKLDASVINNSN